MAAPRLQVIAPDLTLLAYVDDYQSLVWTERWNEPGDFEVTVPLTADNLALFAEDNFLRPIGTKKLAVIERIEAEGDASGHGTLKISGKDSLSLLARRVIKGTVSVNGTASAFAAKCLAQNIGSEAEYLRQIPIISVGDLTALDADAEVKHRVATYRNLLEKLCQVAATVNAAITADYEPGGTIQVSAVAQRSRLTTLAFSEGRLNLLSSRYSSDASGLSTDVYVGGAGEGDERVFAHYSDMNRGGISRREGFKDRRDQGRLMKLSEAFQRFVPPASSYETVVLDGYEPVWETDSAGVRSLADITATATAVYYIAHNVPIASKPVSMKAVYSDGKSQAEQEAFSAMLEGMKGLYDQYVQYDPTLKIATVNGTLGTTLRWEGDTSVTPAWDSWAFEPEDAIAPDEEVEIAEDKYVLVLTELARESWAESQRSEAFEGVPDVAMLPYRTGWKLGDVCKFRTRYGVSTNARIIEAVESWDAQGYKVTPGFEWSV